MKVYIEISNILSTSYVTGIQRVVREVTRHLVMTIGDDLVLLDFNAENPGEFVIINNDMIRDALPGATIKKEDADSGRRIGIFDLEEGAIFFDIQNAWMGKLKRSYYYPRIKERGVYICSLLYDVIPLTHPEYVHPKTLDLWLEYFGAVLMYADLVMPSAHATEQDMETICNDIGAEIPKCQVVALGTGEVSDGTVKDSVLDTIEKAGRYILMVGTMEKRKNHKTVLEAFDKRLFADDLSLIIVGRMGWNEEDKALSKEILGHEYIDKQLFLISDASDEDLAYLYKNAWGVAAASFAEGYGLPVIEALSGGVPVIASDIPVLHEVGGELLKYFDPYDYESFIDQVIVLGKSDEYENFRSKIEAYDFRTWSEVSEDILMALKGVS
jgi:glycosyltransferase involved in cell wall biosynthesis